MCVCVSAHGCACECIHTCVYRNQKTGYLPQSLLSIYLSVFVCLFSHLFETGFLTEWSSPIRRGLLARELQASAHLCPFHLSTQDCGAWCHLKLFTQTWRIWTWTLMPIQQVLHQLSNYLTQDSEASLTTPMRSGWWENLDQSVPSQTNFFLSRNLCSDQEGRKGRGKVM